MPDKFGTNYENKSYPADMAYDNIMCNNAALKKKRCFSVLETNFHCAAGVCH